MTKYTAPELFQIARPLLTRAIDDTKVHDWADALVSGSTRNFSELVGRSRITGPTVRTLHKKLGRLNPEIPDMFPRCFPASQRADGKTQTEALKAQRDEPQGLQGPAQSSHRDLLEKDNFEDLLARHLATADAAGQVNDITKLGERLSKVRGWDQEVHIEYQIQHILPPGGVTALPHEDAPILAEHKDRGPVDAAYAAVQPSHIEAPHED